MSSTVRVAVTNHEPEWLDLKAGVAKTTRLIAEAGSKGAKLIAFPETWLIGYPAWIWNRPVDFELGVKYVENSLGQLVSTRRKMKPTHMERTIFGDASGDCLSDVVEIDGVGRGEQIHVAAWPVLDPFVEGSPGFWSMSAEGTLSTSQVYAVESQTFVLSATTVISEKGVEALRTKGTPLMGTPNNGASAVIGPDGRILAGGLNSPNEELVIADIDLSQVVKAKTFADPIGHYSRPDLLWLGVDKKHKSVVVVKD
ncbi:hypothetical protein DV735_g2447, partial [Chaetothyriales sp. CBS 134920]